MLEVLHLWDNCHLLLPEDRELVPDQGKLLPQSLRFPAATTTTTIFCQNIIQGFGSEYTVAYLTHPYPPPSFLTTLSLTTKLSPPQLSSLISHPTSLITLISPTDSYIPPPSRLSLITHSYVIFLPQVEVPPSQCFGAGLFWDGSGNFQPGAESGSSSW